jgi:hypothetical protein
MTYPRLYVSDKTHARVARIAKKQKTTIKAISDKIVIAGIRILGY